MSTGALLHSLPLVAKMLCTGELPLEEYIDVCLANVEKRESDVLALLPEPNRKSRILREAKELREQFPVPSERPPLFGILVGVKDLFRVNGFETRAGSQLPPNLFRGDEAFVVSKLKELGALVLGKTVTTEFAFMEPGPTRNPHHLQHTPGGSSSGSAAAVASGYCSLALGTQTIGSISRPAAFCGVVGYKPSFEFLSREGVVPFSESADHVGFFTHSVAGAAFVASLLVKNFNQDCCASFLQHRPILGVPAGAYLAQAEPEGLEVFERTISNLEKRGFAIRRLELFPDIENINKLHRAMICAELAQVHGEWFASHKMRYRAGTRTAIEAGMAVDKSELNAARALRLSLRERIHSAMDEHDVDLWLSPAAPGGAPQGLAFTGSPNMNLPWTCAGVPTLSVPSGVSEIGLPFGLQIAARFGCDAALFAWAERCFQ